MDKRKRKENEKEKEKEKNKIKLAEKKNIENKWKGGPGVAVVDT